ncbi:MAG: hypothetical protein IPO06_04890 [Leptospiraceae bacterium]|nr:hypothetical protein [Leptospiraceae bacterium]
MKDSEAIKLAAQEGFSTKTNPQNRGAGLDILIKNTISHQSDKISIFLTTEFYMYTSLKMVKILFLNQ